MRRSGAVVDAVPGLDTVHAIRQRSGPTQSAWSGHADVAERDTRRKRISGVDEYIVGE
jgi:hypothetical protein